MVQMPREAQDMRSTAARSHMHTIRTLLPYLWQRSFEMRGRVLLALILLVLAKVANVYVPILYKQAIDILGEDQAAVIVVPVALLIAYGAIRVTTVAFGELRDALFAQSRSASLSTSIAFRCASIWSVVPVDYHVPSSAA